MHSPLTALLWERWRRTRWAVMAAVLAPVIGLLIRVAGHDLVGRAIAASFWAFGVQLLAVVLLFAQCELKNLNLGFPKRLFRFPVRTAALLAVYMGYGVAAIALPCLVGFAYAKSFGDSLENAWTTFLVIGAMFVWLQTLGWLTGARAVFYFLIPTLAAASLLLYLSGKYDLALGSNVLCVAIIVLCCGISYWNVSADRRGAWISRWRWLSYLFGLFRRRRRKGFASKLHAQRWFESRQTGYLFPLAALIFIGPAVAGKIMGLILTDESPPPALASYESLSELLFLPAIAAWMAGMLIFAVYHRDRTSGASSFWLRRPVTTQALAFSRIWAMARSLVGMLAAIALVVLAMLAWDLMVGAQSGLGGFIPQALADRPLIVMVLMASLALFGFTLTCWTWLQLAWVIFFVIIGLEVAFGLVWLCFGGDLVRTLEFLTSNAVEWSACIVAAALILGTLWAFSVAARRKLIGTPALVYAACVFPLAVVSLWAATLWTGPNLGRPSLMEISYLLGATALPFIPLAATSLSIAKLRHG